MDRAGRVTSIVRRYDRRLYAVRTNTGMLQVFRKAEYWEQAARHYFEEAPPPEPCSQFILAVTDDWTLRGQPVDRGLDPIWFKLNEMDSWRDDSYYERMLKVRDMDEDARKRSQRNNLRAAAADCRKDFAKATNDINTASMRP